MGEDMLIPQAPIWNGEFGPVYQSADDGKPDWQDINESRLAALKHQLEMYSEHNVSWSIWLWKGASIVDILEETH
jgi:aryl-phospho-beta-D-glucosidase BglC (GH1 family)